MSVIIPSLSLYFLAALESNVVKILDHFKVSIEILLDVLYNL